MKPNCSLQTLITSLYPEDISLLRDRHASPRPQNKGVIVHEIEAAERRDKKKTTKHPHYRRRRGQRRYAVSMAIALPGSRRKRYGARLRRLLRRALIRRHVVLMSMNADGLV